MNPTTGTAKVLADAEHDGAGARVLTQPQHTPTPWHTGGRDHNVIYPESGYAIAIAMTYHGHSDDQANAAFIVRACNSHDALVADIAQLRQLTAQLSAALRMVYEMERDRQKWSDAVQPVWVRHVEDALAAAGETP